MRVGLGVVLICTVVCCPADARGINTFVPPSFAMLQFQGAMM
ncbi:MULTISPECIES: hypothetical protein [unclassified Gluconobacter]|nr:MULTISPECIES: hypothetical protein [unclassified Gluconobacter]GFE95294.1 hypothetical protein DmGdi_03670 [Gluconobacter sp. Gdi]